MKVFLFSVCFIAATFARPDVSHLVHPTQDEHSVSHYHIPSTNYGVPLVNNYGVKVHSSDASHTLVPHYNEHHVTYGKTYGVHNNYPSQSHVTYSQHADLGKGASYSGEKVYTNYPSQSHVTYQHAGLGNDVSYSGEKVYTNYPSQSHVTYHHADVGKDVSYSGEKVYTNYPSQSHVTYQHADLGKDVSYSGEKVYTSYPQGHVTYGHDNYGKDVSYAGEKVEEEKHVYFYSAPNVAENTPRLKIHIVPQHKKNTNVLYVKVPEYAVPVPEVVAPPSHVDEKTKVYVLVKNAKEYAPVVFDAPAPIKTSHPELYVVPYKSEHDVEEVISGDNHGRTYGAAGYQFNDQSSFVKSIGSDSAYVHNDKFSHVGPDSSLNLFSRSFASPVANTFVRFDSSSHDVQGRDGDDHIVDAHRVAVPHVGAHHVETHHVAVPRVETHHVAVPHLETHHVASPHVGAHHVETHHVAVPHLESHHVAGPHVGAHHVETHHVAVPHGDAHHVLAHHENEHINTHLVTPLVANTQAGTHSVHTVGGLLPSVLHHSSGLSDGSVTISPLHSIVSSPVPVGHVSYSDHSVTPGFSGGSFVSSTAPTIVHTK